MPPDRRATELHNASLFFIAVALGIGVFPAILLLLRDRYRPVVTGLLMIPALLWFVASILVVILMVHFTLYVWRQ